MRALAPLALAFALALLPWRAAAARFEGTVTHVIDGDTVSVRPLSGGPPQRIRIEGIDAPEICQLFGDRSRDALAARVLRQRVTVVTTARDDYQRSIARLRVQGEDVGGWMVSHGYAWSYRFRGNAGPYRKEEAQARSRRQGLWHASGAQAPRDFRVRHGSCH